MQDSVADHVQVTYVLVVPLPPRLRAMPTPAAGGENVKIKLKVIRNEWARGTGRLAGNCSAKRITGGGYQAGQVPWRSGVEMQVGEAKFKVLENLAGGALIG
jgi:hypothetical protein